MIRLTRRAVQRRQRAAVMLVVGFAAIGGMMAAQIKLAGRRAPASPSVTTAPRTQARLPPPPPPLVAGMQFPDLVGWDERGEPITLRLMRTDRPTVLYVMTPGCDWCRRNRGNFLALATERGGDYKIVLLSLAQHGFREYVDGIRPGWGEIDVQPFTGLTLEERRTLGLQGTPMTIVLDTQGRVEASWLGAYTQRIVPAVENFFLVRMPGLLLDEATGVTSTPAS